MLLCFDNFQDSSIQRNNVNIQKFTMTCIRVTAKIPLLSQRRNTSIMSMSFSVDGDLFETEGLNANNALPACILIS